MKALHGSFVQTISPFSSSPPYFSRPLIRYPTDGLRLNFLSGSLLVIAWMIPKKTFWLSCCLSPADLILSLNAPIASDIGTRVFPVFLNHATTSSRVMIPGKCSNSGPGVGVLDPDFFFLREGSPPEIEGEGDDFRLPEELGDGPGDSE